LHKEPSSKLSLIVRGILPSSTDDGCHTFIDRDARYFQLILNFLRDGWVLLPGSPSERRELMQEARYYQVLSLLLCLANAQANSQPNTETAVSTPFGICRVPLLRLPRNEAHYSVRSVNRCVVTVQSIKT
jgi:hypothetical protein